MKQLPLISIIIPIYKVEAYLEECLESVVSQSYTKWEAILVDDGSPDNCGTKCDEYVKLDKRFIVIHQENQGLSAARNTGLKVANGEYIFFLDSDDYISPNALSVLVEHAISYKADLVCGKYQKFINGNEIGIRNTNCKEKLFSQEEAIIEYVDKDWSAWGKLYKRKVHENIFFPVGAIHEDEAIMFKILTKCKIIVDLNDKLYFYRQRDNSITSVGYSIRKMDWFYHWKNNVFFVNENCSFVLGQCLSKTLMVAFYNLQYLIGDVRFKDEINEIEKFIREYKRNILRNKKIPIKYKIRTILLLISNLKNENCIYKIFYEKILHKC